MDCDCFLYSPVECEVAYLIILTYNISPIANDPWFDVTFTIEPKGGKFISKQAKGSISTDETLLICIDQLL